MAFDLPVRIVREGVDVILTLQMFQEGGEQVCGLRFLSGQISLPPKAMRAVMAEELGKIEGVLKQSGVAEVRHAGDDRGWFLPGYEPMNHPELRNGRRKRL